MKDMNLKCIAKSMLKHADLVSQVNKGFTSIEVHLRASDVEQSIDSKLQVAEEVGVTVVSVHTPLRKGHSLCLKDLLDDNYFNEARYTCELAQRFAEKQGNRVNVVIHSAYSLEDLKADGKFQGIVDRLRQLIEWFPLVDFAIENSMLLTLEYGRPVIRSSIFADPVRMVQALREACEYKHIYTVFDICHMLSSLRFSRECLETNGFEKHSFEEMVEQYKDTVSIVHTANADGYGISTASHGTPLRKDNPDDVQLLIQLLRGFGDKPYYVYEVREEDYTNTVNVVTTHDALVHASSIVEKESTEGENQEMVRGKCEIAHKKHLDQDINMEDHKERIRQMNLDFVASLDGEIQDELNHYDEQGLRRSVEYTPRQGFDLELVHYNGSSIQVVKKENTNPEYVLLHVHGGIFVKRLSEAFNPLLELLAEKSQALVVTPDFRTPPNSSFEDGVNDIVEAYKYALSLGYDAKHIVVFSESSGVAFTLNALLKLNELGFEKVKGAGFFCPYVGFDTTTESYKKYCDTDIVLSKTMIDYVKKAMGLDSNPEAVDKYFNFPKRDLTGLPDMVVIAGEEEIIRSEVIQMLEKAAKCGVNSEVTIVQGMYHSFQHSSALKTADYYFELLMSKIRGMMGEKEKSELNSF